MGGICQVGTEPGSKTKTSIVITYCSSSSRTKRLVEGEETETCERHTTSIERRTTRRRTNSTMASSFNRNTNRSLRRYLPPSSIFTNYETEGPIGCGWSNCSLGVYHDVSYLL